MLRLGAHGFERIRCLAAAIAFDFLEISSQSFQSISFVIDLCLRSNAQPEKDRDGGTPTLHGMLIVTSLILPSSAYCD